MYFGAHGFRELEFMTITENMASGRQAWLVEQ